MQHTLKRALKIFLFSVMALVAFVISFFTGTGKHYGVNSGETIRGVPVTYADAPTGSSGSTGSTGSTGDGAGSTTYTGDGSASCEGSESSSSASEGGGCGTSGGSK